METPAEVAKSKDRSPPFPFISLAKALERARAFYEEERRGAAPLSRAVKHWQYSANSSGGLQTAAALRHYGLIDDVGGSGKERQLQLTDLALRIMLDVRPDSREREDFIRQAALRPTVSAEIHQRWPDGLPKDGTLHHYLVLERKFNEATAPGVIKILRENQEFARIQSLAVESAFEDAAQDRLAVPGETRNFDLMAPIAESNRQGSHAMATTVQPFKAVEVVELALRRRGVAISVRFSAEPTKELYEYLAKYFTFEAENLPPEEGAAPPA